jgi:TolA-binding protein
MTGGASAPKPKPTPAASGPSAQRLAAVRAIAKPQTEDPGDDEYSYGFRLWEAKFYPEAQQQLKMMIDRYPRHAKVSYARNLLGRAFLDDGKARDAATWFLQNYNAGKTGDRASDSLLFLAESMRQLKDVNRSCIALSEFASNFPREAAGRLKAQYDATRSGVKCN